MSMRRGKAIIPRDPLPSADLGPEWSALSCDAYRVFAWARVVLGMNQGKAARLAGYSDASGGSLRAQGYKLDHLPEIIAAKRALTNGLGVAEGARSVRAIIALRDHAMDEKVRLAAARDLLDRFGHGAVSRHEHTVTHELSEEQLDRRLAELLNDPELRNDPQVRKLIAADAIDVEFTEAPSEPTPEEQARNDAENARRRELRGMTPEKREASKAEVRARRTAERKTIYAEAQRAGQTDLEDLLCDGSEGLEDLLGSSSDGVGDGDA